MDWVPGQGRAMPRQKEKEIVEPGRLERGSFVRGPLARRGGRLEPRRPNWTAPDPVGGHGSHHTLLKLTGDRHPGIDWKEGRINREIRGGVCRTEG